MQGQLVGAKRSKPGRNRGDESGKKSEIADFIPSQLRLYCIL